MDKTALVIGAGGMLGDPVARRLKADGWTVRALVRNVDAARGKLDSDFELVPGDATDTNAVARAMEGCTICHASLMSPPGDPEMERRAMEAIAQAAAQAKPARLGYLSGGTSVEANRFFPGARIKLDAEAAVRAAGVPYTIFRPSWVMESMSRLVRDGRAAILGSQVQPLHWVAVEDYARMVATAYATPEAAGKALWIWGPEAKSLEQAVTQYCTVVEPKTKVMKVPFFMASMMAFFTGNQELKSFIPFLRFTAEHPEPGDPAEANRLLGAPVITFEAWCQSRLPRA